MTLTRAYAVVLSLGMGVAILSPLVPSLHGRRGDGFPLSWYPMFAGRRGAEESVTYVIGTGPNKLRHIITSRYYSPGSMNSARRHIARVATNATTGPETCKGIAERVAEHQKGPLSQVTKIKIVRGKFNLRDYFEKGEKKPVSEVTLRVCKVDRSVKT